MSNRKYEITCEWSDMDAVKIIIYLNDKKIASDSIHIDYIIDFYIDDIISKSDIEIEKIINEYRKDDFLVPIDFSKDIDESMINKSVYDTSEKNNIN